MLNEIVHGGPESNSGVPHSTELNEEIVINKNEKAEIKTKMWQQSTKVIIIKAIVGYFSKLR